MSLVAVLLLAAALAAGGLFLAYGIETISLPGPSRTALVALRAAGWFEHHRLADSVIRIGDRPPIAGRCASAWFETRNQRRAQGNVVQLGDGFSVLAVPPHALAVSGGTPADTAVSPLVVLELAGCSHFFAQQLVADAQSRRSLGLRQTVTTNGAIVWELRLSIDTTRVTLFLTVGGARPLAVKVATPRVHGSSSIRFALLSTQLLDALSRDAATERAARAPEQTRSTTLSRLLKQQRPLYCGGDHSRLVALTFDDGPGPYTPLALRILGRAHDPATFFLVGRNLADAGSLVRAERKLGAVGDHTWTHPFLPFLPAAAVAEQLRRTQKGIERLVGGTVKLFRPPYGAANRLIDRDAAHDGMLVVLWSIDSRDSEGAPWYRIASIVESQTTSGSIILMHENHGQTIRALRFRILPWLRHHHFKPVTIPYLLAHDPPTETQLRAGENGCLTTRTKFNPHAG